MREEILQRIAMLPIMHINFGIDPPHFVENKLISVFVDMQHLILFSSLRVAEPYKTYQLFNLRSHAKICFVRSLSFASLFLNAAACRGRGRGGLSFLRPFYRYFYFTGKAMHRFYHTLS